MNDILFKIERKFDLPHGKLTERGVDGLKLRQKYKDIHLSEIRRAVVTYLIPHVKLCDLSRELRLDHTSVLYLKRTGNGFLKTGDKKFISYLEKVKQAI
jgi:hypothetical protein